MYSDISISFNAANLGLKICKLAIKISVKNSDAKIYTSS